MLRILLPTSLMLASCTPPPQEAAVTGPSAISGIPVQSSSESGPAEERPDTPEQAQGRRILSTAFVRIGPDGHMTVELRDGQMLLLRDVVMRASDYCGMQIASGATPGKFCGGYDWVAAARPGGAPTPDQPGLTPAGRTGTTGGPG